MPIYKNTIEYYTCKFKCGHAAKPLHSMENHEKICFCNPETRSCRICNHYLADGETVGCSLLGYEMGNGEKEFVYIAKTGETIYDGKQEMIKAVDMFYTPKERPFPKSNCIHFELGKKAY